MGVYTLTAKGVALAATKDTEKTIAAIIGADSAGVRGKIIGVEIGFPGDTVQDRAYGFSLQRVNSNLSGDAGTPGTSVTAANMVKQNTLAPNSTLSGGYDYSSEPGYDDELWACELNGRNSLVREWNDDDAPEINQDQLIGLVGYPRTADAADEVTVTITYKTV